MNTSAITWQLDPGVRFRRMFDEAVVIHQDQAEALVLNESGVSFLELCDGTRNTDEIIELMLEQYDVPVAELTRDINKFINNLSASGIINDSGKPLL
jgi:hypothetical protein